MNPFRKDQTIYVQDVAMRVVRQINKFEVQLEDTRTGQLSNHKLFELMKQFSSGELLTQAERRHQAAGMGQKVRKPARMDHMSSAARTETHKRIDYLVRLHNNDSFSKSREELIRDLSLVAALRGDGRAPHVTTVYRWRRKLLRSNRDIRAVFCDFGKQGGKGQSRLSPEVEGIIHEQIETVFLGQKRSSAADVHNAVFLEIQRKNTLRVESEWLTAPGLRTIQRRLTELYAYDICVARYGEREAERRFGNYLGSRRVNRILELVEIDHSPVDLMVTDERGIVLGRPTITVVLDRLSRCVLGYHLSLAGHGTAAVFSALRHALLPKTYLKERYADLELEWDCFGWPEVVLMDNGREFHSDAVADALMNIAVNVEFARSRTPNDKPHVERFLKTFNYSFIHRLPGSTLSKVHERIGFKAEDDACLTLEDLDRIIHVWICRTYHQRPHRGLNGRTSMAVWQEGAAACPPQLKTNREDLDIEFSNVADASVQHYGIDLNTFIFVCPRLLTLRRMLPPNSRVLIKWPEYDAGQIFAWDPIENEYFKVPNKDQQYAGLTVEQAKAAKKAKAASEPTSPLSAAHGEAIVRQMTNDKLRDKQLKNRRKGARFANMTSNDSRVQNKSGQSLPTQDAEQEVGQEQPVLAEEYIVEIEAQWGEQS